MCVLQNESAHCIVKDCLIDVAVKLGAHDGTPCTCLPSHLQSPLSCLSPCPNNTALVLLARCMALSCSSSGAFPTTTHCQLIQVGSHLYKPSGICPCHPQYTPPPSCAGAVRHQNHSAPGKKMNLRHHHTMVQTYHLSGGTITQLKTAIVKNVPTMG